MASSLNINLKVIPYFNNLEIPKNINKYLASSNLLLSAHITNRHTSDYTFSIRFANVPMRMEPRERSHHSEYVARYKNKKLLFLSKQCSEDFSSPNIEPSIKVTQSTIYRTPAAAPLACCRPYISIQCSG